MQKVNLKKIDSEKDLQIVLKNIDQRWFLVKNIKDPRIRGKEVLKLRNEVKFILNNFKKKDRMTNLNSNRESVYSKMIKTILSWVKAIENKYKDV
jgi:hypothetical protein